MNILHPFPAGLLADRSRVKMLQASLLVPLHGRSHLLGWLALGKRRNGLAYSHEDMQYLHALCDQGVLAIERGQMAAEMAQRELEMEVLARVAQGVNITVTLDDIFELIYAQVTQIIPADEFRILLKNSSNSDLVQAFYCRGSERKFELENTSLEQGRTLEIDVLEQGHGMLSDDYLSDCRQRNLAPLTTGVSAWLAAPLNAGADSVGLLTLGRTQPLVRYSQGQYRILQAIADQAGGAIVKTRLLHETRQRASQLKLLNEVTRRLTSTLDPDLLLTTILQDALDILKCKAGAVYMLDEPAEDVILKVASGMDQAVASGMRFPAGEGLVGRVLQNGQPVIANQTLAEAALLASGTDVVMPVYPCLAVPLLVKGQAIGVIEVFNTGGGPAFTPNDQDLLSAFAAQAGVAVENARLYTLTDQALAARVEELSVMQRIDRELNTSLEVSRAMHISLDWAMRQSAADAGLIGMIESDGLQQVAQQGYGHELDAFTDGPIPAGRICLEEILQSGRLLRSRPDSDYPGLLEGCRSQVYLPIRREQNLVGLILLESRREEFCPEEVVEFLERLSDHAAIAIANAQLYDAIQAANVAKSEFVSLLAHELKNPMTSIKGYTELLAANAVGPVNEAQANFLAVIRSNVDRMNTLVSDLNDLSKIEAGRMKLEFAAIDLKDIVAEVGHSTQRQIEDKSQNLKVDLPDDLPAVWADRIRLVQVLINLVTNANKYTGSGGEIVLAAQVED